MPSCIQTLCAAKIKTILIKCLQETPKYPKLLNINNSRFVLNFSKVASGPPPASHLVHDGGLSDQPVVRETEATPLAAIIRL